ncbi:glycosyltransferase [Maricaulaceae bacterium NA33B04]|nr:glycosyltransferase [Maricaulaceae bacterium NA33B04]
MARLFTIIPSLNAAATLGRVFDALAEGERTGLSAGWLVADAGSSDRTQDLARRAGAHIVTGACGRGAQLAAGAEAAARLTSADDWYLFLHADTRLRPGWSHAVRRFINEERKRAGYFTFALDDGGRRARRLERAVAARCRLFGLPYGDQGLLISRRFYEALGGYKPWPLFEDVDLVRRIGRRRLQPLGIAAETSAERFLVEGYTRRSARNLTLLARYYMGASPQKLAEAYRK